MRDVDDIEHAEGDRHADRHRCVEAAQKQAGHQGVAQQIEGQVHILTDLTFPAANLAKPVPLG